MHLGVSLYILRFQIQGPALIQRWNFQATNGTFCCDILKFLPKLPYVPCRQYVWENVWVLLMNSWDFLVFLTSSYSTAFVSNPFVGSRLCVFTSTFMVIAQVGPEDPLCLPLFSKYCSVWLSVKYFFFFFMFSIIKNDNQRKLFLIWL
jgi:hypothetical protein